LAVLPSVTPEHLYHCAVNVWTYCNFFRPGQREFAVLSTFTAVLVITVLGIQGLTAMLLIKSRLKLSVLPAVTAVLLQHSAMDRRTDSNVVTTLFV